MKILEGGGITPNLAKINTGTVSELGSPYPKCPRHGFGARFAISKAVGGLWFRRRIITLVRGLFCEKKLRLTFPSAKLT